MAQTIQLKRSATAGNTPTTSQLSLGEIAINTTDGKLFIKRSVSGTESIVEVGSTGSFLPLSGGTLTGSLALGTNTISSGDITVKTSADNAVNQGLRIERSNNSDTGFINYQGGAFRMVATDGDPIRFGHVSDSNEVSIHTDGTLLVAKTNTTFSTPGIELRGGNLGSRFIRSNAEPILVNRTGSEGKIIGVYESGDEIGSIGVQGDDITIGNDNVGLRFGYAGLSNIIPVDIDNNDLEDNVVSLGHANARFKDLILSGTISSGAITSSSAIVGASLTTLSGNVSNGFGNTQLGFGFAGSASYRQAIKTRHNSGTGTGNAIDFFLWDSGTDAVGDLGTLRVASIETGRGIDIVDGGLQIGGSTVVTSLRNLTNIGTISSGVITSTGITVNGTTDATEELARFGNNAGTQELVIEQGGSTGYAIKSSVDLRLYADYDNDTSDAGSNIEMYTDGVERMSITGSTGNVNILNSLMIGSTTAPSYKTHIKNTASWSLAYNNYSNDLFVENTSSGAGVGNFGGSIGFSGAGTESTNKRVVIASVQTGSDQDQCGLAFFTHPSQYGSHDIEEALRISHDKNASFSGSVTSTGLTVDGNNDIQINRDGISSAKIFWNRSGTTDAKIELDASENLTIAVDEAQLGSKSLVFKNNNADGLLISSSQNVNIPNGSVGIGFTTAPSYPLEVQSGGVGTVLRAGTSFVSIDSVGSASSPSLILNGDDNTGIWHPTADTLAVSTGGSERLRIGSTGIIYVNGDATGGRLSGDGSGGLVLQDGNGRQSFKIMSPSSGSVQAMTLDASSNLLVGKTATSSDVVGTTLWSSGHLNSTVSASYVARFNRKTSDGEIINLQKDGSTVGSIGTKSGDLAIGTGDTGVRFDDAINAIYAHSMSANAYLDAIVDLGYSGIRFKNLYLSNAIYLKDTVDNGVVSINFGTQSDTVTGSIAMRHDSGNAMQFNGFNNTERMRIDSSGNLLVGTTDSNVSNNNGSGIGFNLLAIGQQKIATDNNLSLILNRLNGDGGILEFKKDGSAVGSISSVSGISTSYNSASGTIFIGGDQTNHIKVLTSTGTGAPRVEPSADNAINLGQSAARFKDLYLTSNLKVGVAANSFQFQKSSTQGFINLADSGNIIFRMTSSYSEKARLTTDGSFLLGTATPNGTGITLNSSNYIYAARSGGAAIFLNRTTSAGAIQEFRADGTTKGNISVSAYGMGFGGGTRTSDFFIKTDGTASFASSVQIGNNIPMWSGSYGGALLLKGNNATTDRYAQLAIVDSTGSLANNGLIVTNVGNVLIGKTADDDSTVGIRMQSTGHTSIVKSGGNCLTLNRLSSDGSLLDFRKDTGTVVGSIANDSTALVVTGSSTGLKFGSAAIWPTTGGGVLNSNGAKDLGASTVKFANAYFSGTVNSASVISTGLVQGGSLRTTVGTDFGSQLSLFADSNGHCFIAGFTLNFNVGSNNSRTTKVKIDSDGRTMIGATTPRRNLLVGFTSTDTNTSSTSSGFGNSSNVGNGVMINNTSTTNNTYAPLDFLCGSTIGRIAYKSINQGDEFGQFEFITVDDGSAVNALTIASGGNGTFAGSCTATSFPTSSDVRLKDNIEDAKDSGEIIDKIKVRQFDWKKTGKHQDYGMIAQELILEVPDAVSTPTEDHEMMGIDYSKLVPLMMKEIQNLRKEIKSLKEKE